MTVETQPLLGATGAASPHTGGAEIVRDIILGMSDGLTVPFALAAGLSSLDSTAIVIAAGFAELVAGSISMGLGGYLAGRSELDHYHAERARELQEVAEAPDEEVEEVYEIFHPYGLTPDDLKPMIARLRRDPDRFVDFMMKFELELSEPDPNRSLVSAFTIGASYFVGGLVPLVPYFFMAHAWDALLVSVAVTLLALLLFGVAKAKALGQRNVAASALWTMLIGAVAAGAAFGLVKVFNPE
ncbi:DUF125-domain-containing protein [Ramicandelaber brevisporus]|nr:DUF125-domain-containing protein [Ramicandelaber brevisporus]